MHFGLICNEYPPAAHGGIGSSNFDLAEGLAAAGHEVTVIGVYAAQHRFEDLRESVNRPKIVRLKTSPTWLGYRSQVWFDRWRLHCWLAREHACHRFDLIEFSDYGGWLPWGGPKGVPVVCRLQGTNAFFDRELSRVGDEFEHELERRSLQRADSWIGLSQFVFSKTLSLCHLEQHPGAIIHHAVDAELFSPGKADEAEPGLVVFVNSLNPKKGI